MRSTRGAAMAPFLTGVAVIAIGTIASAAWAEEPAQPGGSKNDAPKPTPPSEINLPEGNRYYQFESPQILHRYDAASGRCSIPDQDHPTPEPSPAALFSLFLPPWLISSPPATPTSIVASRGTSFVVLGIPNVKDSDHLVIQICESTWYRRLFGVPKCKTPSISDQDHRPSGIFYDKYALTPTIDDSTSQYGKYYCLDQEQIKSKAIVQKYRRGYTGPVYGIGLNLPFKLRRALPGFNTTIDKNIEIASSLGVRWQISDTQHFYLNFPVVSAGLPMLDIGKGTAPSAMTSSTQTTGVSASTGMVLELSDVQLELMIGVDRATGDAGKGWIYNGKPWFSFGFGYSFLKNSPSNAASESSTQSPTH